MKGSGAAVATPDDLFDYLTRRLMVVLVSIPG